LEHFLEKQREFAGAFVSMLKNQPDMKRLCVFLFAVVCLSGCARYDVTLNDGSRLINMRKPVLNKETREYVIKDASGNKHYVPAGRVTLIQPHVKPKFKPKKGSDPNFFITPS
jgi:hypothetical protein